MRLSSILIGCQIKPRPARAIRRYMIQLCTYCYTVCPKSADPFHIVSYYVKLVTTSWTYSMIWIKTKTSVDEMESIVETTRDKVTKSQSRAHHFPNFQKINVR